MPRFENKAFTLLEIMASVAILAIVLTALFRLHTQTLSMGASAHTLSIAPFLAQEKMAQLEAEGIEKKMSDSGDFGKWFPGMRWEASVTTPDIENLPAASQLLRKIEVKIVDASDNDVYRLETFRYAAPK